MDNIENNVLDISHNYYKYIMSLKNVNGVGLGFKTINGICTKEPCIHVLVEEKIEEKYLTKNNIVPKTYMGIKTDIIKRGKVSVCKEIGKRYGIKIRPLKGGCQISIAYYVTKEQGEGVDVVYVRGTLGCIVTKKKNLRNEYFILSNNHLMAHNNNAPIGTSIIQPNFKGADKQIVAYLSNFIHVNFADDFHQPINYADAAIAKITKKSLISNEIMELGRIKGVSKATLGLNVKKSGAKTGVTKGKITSIGVTESIDFKKNEWAVFSDIIVSDINIKSGDSGSCILNDNNEVIGLLYAGTEKSASINDINYILEHFNVKIYTG